MRRLKKTLKVSAMCCLLMAGSVVILRLFVQFRERKASQLVGLEVDVLEMIQVGGLPQWIRVRGRDRTKPLLVFLHGGPGFPQMPFSAKNLEWEKDFVVVYWDERGAGKSYPWGMSSESMRVEQFVSDVHELVTNLLHRFNRPKCYLVAHSWGTIFGGIEASRHPELYYAYIGTGQIANYADDQTERFAFALKSAQRDHNEAALAELRKIGPPPHPDMKVCAVMEKWVRVYARRQFTGISMTDFVVLAFRSPDYTWNDLAKIPAGFAFSSSALWREIYYETNLYRQAQKFEIPVYLIAGKFDEVAPLSAVQRYFSAVDAPNGKQLIEFERSAHWTFLEQPEEFHVALVKIAAEVQANTVAK